MNIEEFHEYCSGKKGVAETFPFGETTLVFKVMGKMFALADIEEFNFINLKCDPDRAIELREKYKAVQPGYHMNKQQWNSVYVNDDVSDKLIYEMIDDSYDLIVASLTKKLQKELEAL